MANVIKLRKGLNINLKGRALKECTALKAGGTYALTPNDFVGLTPKIMVKEGDSVKAGDVLFVDKKCPDVCVVAPASGTVTEVVRGERRKLLCIKVKMDAKQQSADFSKDVKAAVKGTADEVVNMLLKTGMFAFFRQLPYAVVASPNDRPKAIFVSAFRDMPLAADVEYQLEGEADNFQKGLDVLSSIADTHLGVSAAQKAAWLTDAKNVKVTVYDGPCPAGNVGVQVNHIAPVNKGEVVWTIDPLAVCYIGRLMNTGHTDFTHRVAVAGSEVKAPAYVEVMPGTALNAVLKDQIADDANVRIIMGNPLTGRHTTADDTVGMLTSEVTVIPEGDNRDELLGWMMPRFKEFSANHSYFSWLLGRKREYALDARIKGGKRHMIMSGEYDKVFPMDIYPEYLIKAIIAGDIDKMEQLGIYEVAPEDFAVAEFVDSSKLELQRIVREGLDMLRKENA